MQIIILLLIIKEDQAFLCKYVIFRKFGLKFLKNIFLKISLLFLVEDGKPFHLICECTFFSVQCIRVYQQCINSAYESIN